MEDSEAKLIARCKEGDQEAMRYIFDSYREKVYRIAYGMLRHREDALDVVQEVFLKLFGSLKKFEAKSSLYTYVYKISVNTAIDYARKRKKERRFSPEEEGGAFSSEPRERGPEQIVMSKDLESRVRRALERLPRGQKAAIILREIEGLTYQEMAEIMGCSMGTVMSRLHYGRKRLQELLKPYLSGG